MTLRHLALVVFAATVCLFDIAALADEPAGRAIFDGESFAGWEGNLDWFRVEDKAVVAGTMKKPIPRNEFLCTEREYGDFELTLKAKLLGDAANAGIQFRTKRIPNHHEVSGYQCDMGVVSKDHNIWGALYDESRRRRFLAEPDQAVLAKAFRPNDWNEFRIRCEGPRIQIWLNGQQTIDYTESDADIARSGVIALQIHSGPPSEAWYKDVRIRELK